MTTILNKFYCYFPGPIYDKSNRAVKVTSQNEVVLSADDRGATAFMLVGCRAWDTVSEALRPRCFSLVQVNRTDWYVRHSGFFLRVDPKPETDSQVFDADSSFILHSDTFYPGYYALESVNFPDYYIRSLVDGRLRIKHRQETIQYNDTASFMISNHDMSGN